MTEAAAYSYRGIEYIPFVESTAAWEPISIPISDVPLLFKREIQTSPQALEVDEIQLTQQNLVESEEAQVQLMIRRIRTVSSTKCLAEVADRLITLFEDSKVEDPTKVAISLASLRHFLSFMQSKSNFRCPMITLSPDNDLYISWRPDGNKVFSALFWPDGGVSFAIFKPNERHIGEQICISGKVTADVLKETVAPHGVLDWILN